MGEIPEVGPWAKEKLDALARYLDFYTKVLKNQRWRTIYLDAYAAGGRAVIRAGESSEPQGPDLFRAVPPMDPDARELVEGSPLVARRVAHPFDSYVFVEPDADRVAELEALKAEFCSTRTITVLRKTAREGIAWITAQPITRRTHRGVAFLDPFGAGLDWASVQKLADTDLFEVVINFPLSWLYSACFQTQARCQRPGQHIGQLFR